MNVGGVRMKLPIKAPKQSNKLKIPSCNTCDFPL